MKNFLLSRLIIMAVVTEFCISALSENYTFRTMAGNAGYGMGDGIGSQAKFLGLGQIALDNSGDIYVADISNDAIRMLTLVGTNWQVMTIAGLPGIYGSNDGTNDSARFYAPEGIVVDSAGNVYVADFSNCTIRKIVHRGTNWVVTTIAGQPGNQGSTDGTNGNASFHSPHGLAVDNAGNLYVTEYLNYGIRKITPVGTNWVVTTIAGSAAGYGSSDGTNSDAQFEGPGGIAVDTNGVVYVADYWNHNIRRVAPIGTNWVVTTIAGHAGVGWFGSADGTNSDARFHSPGGVSVAVDGTLYVTDSDSNHTLRKIVQIGTNWVVTTIAGSVGNAGVVDGTNTAARFAGPADVTIDYLGNLFVSDGSTVREIAAVGTNWVVSTLAGSIGGAGTNDGVGDTARFNQPTSIVADSLDNIIVADTQNSTIREIASEGTNWVTRTIAGLAGTIDKVDGTNSNARFYNPQGVAVDQFGNVFVADTFNCTIRRISPLGTDWVASTIAGKALYPGNADGTNAAARFNCPCGIAVATNGDLYVADSTNNIIRKITLMGTNWVVNTIAGLAGKFGSNDGTNSVARFSNPRSLALSSAGYLYVSDTGNNTIRRMTSIGTNWIVTTIAGLAGSSGSNDGTNSGARFLLPSSIAVDFAENLYVTVWGAAVRKITPIGTNWVTTTIGGGVVLGNRDGTSSNAWFRWPQGVAVDGSGNVFVADTGNNTIRLGWTTPYLQMILSGRQIYLAWPASATGYTLEHADNLTAAGSWSAVTNDPTIVNFQFLITNDTSNGNCFYRLEHQ